MPTAFPDVIACFALNCVNIGCGFSSSWTFLFRHRHATCKVTVESVNSFISFIFSRPSVALLVRCCVCRRRL